LRTGLIVLRSEIPSVKCAELRTAAASNNRDHSTRSLYYCLFAPRILWCCSSRTSRSWWIVYFSATSTERLQQNRLGTADVNDGLGVERSAPVLAWYW